MAKCLLFWIAGYSVFTLNLEGKYLSFMKELDFN